MRLIIASNNENKVREFEQILAPAGIQLASLKQLGLEIEVEEDCDTFEGNALKKARKICETTGEAAIADDSGLEVDFLDGAPGVYSARFSGPDADSKKNNEKLLKLLEGTESKKRTARFVCVIAVALPDGQTAISRGECEGIILNEYRGIEGFGYDPLFYCPPLKKTFAEMTKDEKNSISHRGKALEGLKESLRDLLNMKK